MIAHYCGAQTLQLNEKFLHHLNSPISYDTIISNKIINTEKRTLIDENTKARLSILLIDSMRRGNKNESSLSLITSIVTTNTYCEKRNGRISLLVANGIGPYQFSIDDGPPNPDGNFFNLGPGDHTVKVQDAAGVTDIASVTLTNTFTAPSVSMFEYNYIGGCNDKTGSFTVKPIGGLAPYTYTYDGVTYQSNPTFSDLYPGTYNTTVKDANGCTAKIDEYINPSGCHFGYSMAGGNASCHDNDGIIDFIANGSGTTPPYLYSLDNVHYQTTGYFTGLAPGNYQIHIKDAVGYTGLWAYTVFRYCYLNTTATVINPICGESGGVITLSSVDGVAPYTYAMDGHNFQNSNIFTGLTKGFYSFTTRDATGQIDYTKAYVSTGCLSLTASETTGACGGNMGSIGSVATDGTPPYSYSIDGVSFQINANFTGLSAGSYTITVKDANSVKVATQVTIQNSICLSVIATTTNATCGNNNGIINVVGSGGIAPYRYSIDGSNFSEVTKFSNLAPGTWTIAIKDASGKNAPVIVNIINIASPEIKLQSNTADCLNKNGSINISGLKGTASFLFSIDDLNYQSNNTFNNLSAGLYTGYIKDANGCIAKDTITVFRLPLPSVFIGNDTLLCVGDSLLLKANPIAGNTYVWQDASTFNQFMLKNAGEYYVTLTNQFNCSISDTINIFTKQLPVFTLGNDTSICSGTTLKLQHQLPSATYKWSTGSSMPDIAITKAGLYWLEIEQSGCHKTDSLLVLLKPLPLVFLGKDTTLCEGKTLLLDLSNPGDSFLWQDHSKSSAYLISASGTYSVIVTRNGCIFNDAINISYKSKPLFSLGHDQYICQNKPVILAPLIKPEWQLKWQDGNNNSAYKITQPGYYFLDATNDCGTSREGILFTKGLCNIYIPKAFTPNADSKNDFFKVYGTELVSQFHLLIYDRYGHVIFETKDKSKGWDGNYNNQPASSGNYVYLLEYKEVADNEIHSAKGSCLLLR